MVKLVIKAPNQKIDDCEVQADMAWTVAQLKDHLSLHYPSRPAPHDQRLIYSGHLMKDEQTLRQVFRSDSVGAEAGETLTLHLVCRVAPVTASSPPAPASPPRDRTSGGQPPLDAATPRTLAGGSSPLAAGNPVTNAVAAAAAGFPMQATPVMTAGLGLPTPFMWTPEQLALAQQMYQQLMSQIQANPALLPNLMPSLAPTVSPHAMEPGLLSPAATLPPNPPVNRNDNHVVPNPAPVAAAVVRDDEDDDDDVREERDFLGWFYWMSRAVVLFSVVYFYSSMARLVVVLLFAILMYLYQVGVFVPRNADDLMPEAMEEQAIGGEGAAADAPREEGDAGAGVVDGEQLQAPLIGARRRTSAPAAASEPVTERSGLRLLWVLVSSLFTSLIPEQPPAHFN